MEVQVSLVNKSTMLVDNVIEISTSDDNIGSVSWEQNVLDFASRLFSSEDNIFVLTNKEGRKNSGGVGMIYSEDIDDFYFPQTDENLILDDTTLKWVPPIPMPERTQEHIDNGQVWTWNTIENKWDLHSEDDLIPPWEK
jgi:hypothetical protein